MEDVCSVLYFSLHSIRPTAGTLLSCWAQTNPRGRPQHIWTDCNASHYKTRFILGNPSRVTTHSLHSPTHCYSNQRRQHTITGDSGDLSVDGINTHRTCTQTHNILREKQEPGILSFPCSFIHTDKPNKQTHTPHTEGPHSSGDLVWSCQAKDCYTIGREGRTGKRRWDMNKSCL